MLSTSPAKKSTWRSILRTGLTMFMMSRSLAAISCSIGVKRKKLSRFTSVTSMSEFFHRSNSSAEQRPAKPPPRMSTRDFLSLIKSLFAVDVLEASKIEFCGTDSGEIRFTCAVAEQRLSPLCDECQHCAVTIEVPAEYTGRREVFGAVKCFCLLFPVNEIAIPNGSAQEKPVRLRLYRWYIGI